MDSPEVLITGAGPTGLTAAVELKRFGISFRLIDKSTHAAQYSQALVVQARTLEQFERYGLGDLAVQRGRKLQKATLFSNGKEIFSFALDHIPSRYAFVLFLPQNDTESLLTEHLHSLGGEIERGLELTQVEQQDGQVRYALHRQDGSTEEGTCRWLIGCDGAHSKVREALRVPFSGGARKLFFLLGDFEMEGPDKLGDELRGYAEEGDFVFMGRVNDTISRVIIGLHSAPEDADNRQLTIADFQGPLDHAGVKVKLLRSTWMTPFHVNERQAEHYRIGNVFLAGDASHIHSPAAGQGMNAGIQDVANLSWKIAAVRAGAEDSLLTSYEEERHAVGEALLKKTSSILNTATIDNTIMQKLRDTIAPILAKIPALQHSMMSFVSETNINYRGSSIVVDAGGEGLLHAGDRVPNPDLVFADGRRERLLKLQENSRPLAIAVNTADEASLRSQLNRAEFLSIQTGKLVQESRAEIEKLLGKQSRIIIVRPDGYIGFRGGEGDHDQLMDYARMTALTSSTMSALTS